MFRAADEFDQISNCFKNEAMYQRETFLEDLSQNQRNIPRINVIQGESFDLNKQNWILLLGR